ncbi:hypothetical protein [Novilysobacter arseniciresistens]|uniref:hypothetical protein n=1 Tax=Novilysobacter arseniciresistens TaxID=1385522 RepID=UPI00126A71F0|nr:hypothetical protein [Lysobacter arseniciresistens]
MRNRFIRNIAATSCCALLAGCVSGVAADGFGSQPADEPTIGWLHGPCIALADDNVAPGSAVTVVTLDDPQRVAMARIEGRAEAAEDCPALIEDRREANLASGVSFYRVAPLDEAALAIGVLQSPGAAAGSEAALDINRDGRRDTYGHCATAEGIRFFVRGDPDGNGRPLWTGYYYLGYDLQPDCSDDLAGT